MDIHRLKCNQRIWCQLPLIPTHVHHTTLSIKANLMLKSHVEYKDLHLFSLLMWLVNSSRELQVCSLVYLEDVLQVLKHQILGSSQLKTEEVKTMMVMALNLKMLTCLTMRSRYNKNHLRKLKKMFKLIITNSLSRQSNWFNRQS